MSLSLGLVGLPNVGKSTLFKALTKKQVDASNYPFCTIDPNVGVVAVPDARLDALARVSHSAKVLGTTIEFVDIAGLVAGAHKGEGLGNKFLANIREVDAIVHVVRSFTDPNVIHVQNSVDAQRDAETITLELIMADLATVLKRIDGNHKAFKSGDKEAAVLQHALEKIKKTLDEGRPASTTLLEDDEKAEARKLTLLTMKPMLHVINIAEEEIKNPPHFSFEHQIPISAKIEAELSELSSEESSLYLKELGISSSGLDQLITASYELLELMTYFTSGEKETRAWTIRRGTKAPEAAGKIHSDFEKGFIKADTIDWKSLVDSGGWTPAKEKGLVRLEGKEYTMRDGDVCLFYFSH